MLDRLQLIARRWRWLKRLSLSAALLLLAGAAATVLLLPTEIGDRLLLPLLVGGLWALSGFLFVYVFEAVPASAPASGQGSLFRHLGRRLVRGLYWLLALAFIGFGIAVLLLTIRLIKVWLGGMPG